jgi:phage gp45-like
MQDRLHEMTMELRGTVMRGLVQRIDDTGPVQTVDVQTHDGMLRTGIEVWQFFGLATKPPAVGSVVLLLANGADPGDLIALPPIAPALRFGQLADNETVLYAGDGSRVAIRAGGTIDILAATQVNIVAPDVTLTASGSLTIAANVAIEGALGVTGNITWGAGTGNQADAIGHQHNDPQGGTTSPPIPGT